MAIDQAVTPVDGFKFSGANGTPKAKSELDMTTFLRLLTTQLANQNPLEPMSDRDYFAQMAQLGTVQGIDTLNKSQDAQNMVGMVGKRIVAVRPGNETDPGSNLVDGIATGTIRKNGETFLTVKEADGGSVDISLKAIQSVSEASSTQSTTNLVALSQSAGLIGKQVTVPHPTVKDANGKPEVFTGPVKSVSFENGSIMLSVTDKGGSNVKVRLSSVQSFSN